MKIKLKDTGEKHQEISISLYQWHKEYYPGKKYLNYEFYDVPEIFDLYEIDDTTGNLTYIMSDFASQIFPKFSEHPDKFIYKKHNPEYLDEYLMPKNISYVGVSFLKRIKLKKLVTLIGKRQATIALMISLSALSWTWYIDNKNYKASYSEEVLIDVCDDGSLGRIKILYDSIHQRIVVRKLLKIDLFNNSNKGVIIKDIAWAQEKTPYEAVSTHYHAITWYKWGTIKNDSEDLGESKINIGPNNSVTVYKKFNFTLSTQATNFIRDSLMKKDFEFYTTEGYLEDELHSRGIPLFTTPNYPEGDKRGIKYSLHLKIARIKLFTVNKNYFDERFAYHCHLEQIDRL